MSELFKGAEKAAFEELKAQRDDLRQNTFLAGYAFILSGFLLKSETIYTQGEHFIKVSAVKWEAGAIIIVLIASLFLSIVFTVAQLGQSYKVLRILREFHLEDTVFKFSLDERARVGRGVIVPDQVDEIMADIVRLRMMEHVDNVV